MLDLSADNQDGFEDTDGQLYTSNSFYFRVIYMFYYERKDGYIMETRPTVIEDGPRQKQKSHELKSVQSLTTLSQRFSKVLIGRLINRGY